MARPLEQMPPLNPAPPIPPPKRGGLPSWGWRAAEALADTAIPIGKRVRKHAGPVVAEKLDSVLAELPWLIRFGYLAALWMLEWTSVLFAGRRFSRLNHEKRLHVLERWHAGSFGPRIALRGLLTPVKVAFYGDPEVSAALGYAPPGHAPKAGALDALPAGDIRFGAAREPEEIACDVVVVGTGAGGAVVAKELAERGRKVVLIEEGEYFTRPQFNRRSFEMTRLLYRDYGFTLALGRPGIPIPLGKSVGGTTTINSGTCFRVPEHTIARWHAEEGLHELTSGGLAHYYEKVEKFIRVQPVPQRVLGRNSELVMKGAAALGLHARPLDRNADGCEGSGVCCFGCPEDAKRSMNVSYVPAAIEKGATLYTSTVATQLLMDGGRAVGVAAEMGPHKAPLRVRAGAVVVAGGTIYTPVFLQKQGLGRVSHALGRNLSIHPACKVYAFFDEPVRGWEGVPQGLGIHDLHEEGILFEGVFMTPDYASIGFPSFGPEFVASMEKYDHLATFGFLVEDASQGRVKVGPDGRPLILYNLGEAELSRIRKGLMVLTRLFFAAGARVVYPPLATLPELRKVEECERVGEVRIRPEDLELSAFHPLGTCRFATDARRGVLDPDLEAWELDNLYVADGSIFPTSLGVNPQLTIMAFATRAAQRIDERLSGSPRRYPRV